MSCRSPVMPHFSSSSPNFLAYARMAASTASMCLRRESLSVHSHSSSQDSSRFTGSSNEGFRAAILPSAIATTRHGPPLATLVGEPYDAAARVRLLNGAGRVVGCQDDLEA